MTALSGFNIDKVATVALVAVGIFVLYKVYKTGSAVIDGVSGAVGWVADKAVAVAEVTGEVLTGAKASEIIAICSAALKAKGLNPDDYMYMFPQPKAGEKLPPGSWVVTYQNKKHYFAKKGSVGFWPFSL